MDDPDLLSSHERARVEARERKTRPPRMVVDNDTEPTSRSTRGRNRTADQSAVPSSNPTPAPAMAAK